MKPQIRRCARGWLLVYRFPPRSMWLFGLSADERKAVADRCICHEPFETQKEALVHLRALYEARQVAR